MTPQVVAYDDANGSFAARLWWMLRWLGHTSVAVLDGGFKAWVAGGGALELGDADSRSDSAGGADLDGIRGGDPLLRQRRFRWRPLGRISGRHRPTRGRRLGGCRCRRSSSPQFASRGAGNHPFCGERRRSCRRRRRPRHRSAARGRRPIGGRARAGALCRQRRAHRSHRGSRSRRREPSLHLESRRVRTLSARRRAAAAMAGAPRGPDLREPDRHVRFGSHRLPQLAEPRGGGPRRRQALCGILERVDPRSHETHRARISVSVIYLPRRFAIVRAT